MRRGRGVIKGLLVKHKGNKHGPLKWKGNKKDSKQAICMLIIGNWRGWRVTGWGLRGRKEVEVVGYYL